MYIVPATEHTGRQSRRQGLIKCDQDLEAWAQDLNPVFLMCKVFIPDFVTVCRSCIFFSTDEMNMVIDIAQGWAKESELIYEEGLVHA